MKRPKKPQGALLQALPSDDILGSLASYAVATNPVFLGKNENPLYSETYLVGGTGLEPALKAREKADFCAERSNFVAAPDISTDPQLSRLIAAWPNLSAGVQKLILDLVFTGGSGERNT
jgi:hypothetical protein